MKIVGLKLHKLIQIQLQKCITLDFAFRLDRMENQNENEIVMESSYYMTSAHSISFTMWWQVANAENNICTEYFCTGMKHFSDEHTLCRT